MRKQQKNSNKKFSKKLLILGACFVLFLAFSIHQRFLKAEEIPPPLGLWDYSCNLVDDVRCGATIQVNGMLHTNEGIKPTSEESYWSVKSPNDTDVEQRIHVAEGSWGFDVKGINVAGSNIHGFLGRIVTLPRGDEYHENFLTNFSRPDFSDIDPSPDPGDNPDPGITLTPSRVGGTKGSIWTQGLICTPKIFRAGGGSVITLDDGWYRVEQHWRNEEFTATLTDIQDPGLGDSYAVSWVDGDRNATNFMPKKNVNLQLGSEILSGGESLGNGYFPAQGNEIVYRNITIRLGSIPEEEIHTDQSQCYETPEPEYAIRSCSNENITEDRPNEPVLEPEDPLPLADISTGGVDFNLDEFSQASRGAIQNPTSRPRPITLSPKPGQKVQVIADNRYFNSDIDEIYSTWCLNGKIQQGLVAGGKEITETINDSKIGPCCDSATRSYITDTDGDGMDDAWEEFYFVGKNINGEEITNINQVSGDGDPDHDGFHANDHRKVDPPRGAPVRIAPNSVSAPLQSQGNERKKLITGDGVFTNLEEYIWGTDPTNPDSDNDGKVDEADISGEGQGELYYKAVDELGKTDNIRVTSVGMANKKVIKIDSFAQDIIVGKGEPLSVELSVTPDIPAFDSDIIVDAHTFGTEKSSAALEYTWIVNDVTLDAPYSGFGKRSLTVPRQLPSGEELIALSDQQFKVSVNVIEKVGPGIIKEGEGEAEYYIGDTFELSYSPNCQPLPPVGDDPCPTRNSVVTVTANLMDFRGPHFQDPDKPLLEVLRYSELVWYVDGKKMQSARHPMDDVYPPHYDLKITKYPGQEHIVKLEIYGNKGKQFAPYAVKSISIPIHGPSIKWDTNPWQNGDGEIIVSPGQRVSLYAGWKDFQYDVYFTWHWMPSGNIGEDHNIEIRNNTTFLFDALNPGATYTVSVRIDAEPQHPDAEHRKESANSLIKIKVLSEPQNASNLQNVNQEMTLSLRSSMQKMKSFAFTLIRVKDEMVARIQSR